MRMPGALAAAIVLPLAPAGAQASEPEASIGTVNPSSLEQLAPLSGEPSTQAACIFTAYGYTGRVPCEFRVDAWTTPGGEVEYFMVGTDYAMWHIWPGSGGWKSLGGRARAATPNGAYVYFYPRDGVQMIGTDNQWWCLDYNGGTWRPGWYRCINGG